MTDHTSNSEVVVSNDDIQSIISKSAFNAIKVVGLLVRLKILKVSQNIDIPLGDKLGWAMSKL